MALVIGLDLAFRLPLAGGRWLLGFAAVTPAVIDWSRIRLFGVAGPRAIRPITGALAGVGLGLALADHLRNPREPWVWALLAAVTAVVALVIFVSRTPE
jgi:Zn-dependent protease